MITLPHPGMGSVNTKRNIYVHHVISNTLLAAKSEFAWNITGGIFLMQIYHKLDGNLPKVLECAVMRNRLWNAVHFIQGLQNAII